jgi:hypothetical protein
VRAARVQLIALWNPALKRRASKKDEMNNVLENYG